MKAELARPRGVGTELNLLPWPQVDFAKFGPVQVKPLSRIKKISAANLHRNWVMIPHVTQFDEADVTELEALRKNPMGQRKKRRKGYDSGFPDAGVGSGFKKISGIQRLT